MEKHISVSQCLKISILLLLTQFIILSWSVIGIQNDDLRIFRYLNYFGFFVMAITVANVFFFFFLNVKGSVNFVFYGFSLVALLFQLIKFFPYYIGDTGYGDSNITVVSFSKMTLNKDLSKITKIVDCSLYDVIMIQESFGMEPMVYKECNSITNDKGSLSIYSRYNLVQTFDYGFAFGASLKVGQKNIEFITLRLDKTLSNNGYNLHNKEVSKLLSYLKKSEYTHYVIGGDFNSTLFNSTPKKFLRYADYMVAPSKWLFDSTFPSNQRRIGMFGSMLRIDHIFAKGFKVKNLEVSKDSYGSDHFPIIASLELINY